MIEVWRPAPGFEGWYEVSSLGRVRRVMPACRAVVGAIIKAIPNHKGYLRVQLCKTNVSTKKRVHRLVIEAFVGPKPFPTAQVNHIDCVKTNNTPENLEWVSPSENIQHAIRMGRRVGRPRRAFAQPNQSRGA